MQYILKFHDYLKDYTPNLFKFVSQPSPTYLNLINYYLKANDTCYLIV